MTCNSRISHSYSSIGPSTGTPEHPSKAAAASTPIRTHAMAAVTHRVRVAASTGRRRCLHPVFDSGPDTRLVLFLIN
ncbi:hypothetical protein BLA3211_01371 [Burkholderia aenigmatica]|uniref:Uncharacterized protein n=1 Tax=Burkholderia aenigmatica TaxID=2015348 RepID=A0A6J5IUL9_9BURK|nr:hypothetical protein BLA3211_01371 [Burkholderia aenigmatica]